MLGYRGHFLTKSRRYSVTFKALRQPHGPPGDVGKNPDGEMTPGARPGPHIVRLALLTYAGTGQRTTGDAPLALPPPREPESTNASHERRPA